MRAHLLLVALGCSALTHGQGRGVVFATYDDLVQGKGDTLGVFQEVGIHMGRYVLDFQQEEEKKKERVPCSEIWGFKVNELLFRILEPDHVPLRLMTQGAVCYYENGLAHLRMWSDSTDVTMIDKGLRSYMSRELNSPIVPAVFTEDEASASAVFRREHPQFEHLFKCIGGEDDLLNTRQCVVDFEAMLEGP
ncbi:MAG: hypothetical protein KDB88_04460 [Flavobacteriales bacterium]|nr:hypothetical protein [Flavobacteriales bacterium]